MDRPWTAEREVPSDLARALIEAQFPDLAPARVEPLGAGWDNTAYRAGDWVFRFPRRESAVALLETEVAILPAIAPRLPLAIPVPTRVGRHGAAGGRTPWPFAAYRWVPGRVAARCGLDADQRGRAAPALARFLAVLHGVPAGEAADLGTGPDTLGRLDVALRLQRTEEHLALAARLGLLEDPGSWDPVLEEAPPDWSPSGGTLVHGDLDARHILVDDDGGPCGVIDWGDVHLGDPAVDLALAHSFLPAPARDAFRRAYGTVDEDAWRVARLRALHHAAVVLVYGHDQGDGELVCEARVALGHLAE